MMYILAKDEPLMHVLLTEKDVQIMRPGRTVFLDLSQQGIVSFKVSNLVLSLHKDVAAINDVIVRAGHGAHLANLVEAPHAEADEECCTECGGINKKFNLHLGKCIVCWQKLAMANLAGMN